MNPKLKKSLVFFILLLTSAFTYTAISDGGSTETQVFYQLNGERAKDSLVLEHPSDGVDQIVFSPDGRYIASRMFSLPGDATTYIWNVNTRQCVKFLGSEGSPKSLAFSPDGKYLAVGIAKTFNQVTQNDVCIVFFDVETGEKINKLRRTVPANYNISPVEDIAFSPDGKYLAAGTGHGEGVIEVWSIGSGTLVKALTGVKGHIRNLSYSPDGKYIAVSNYSSSIHVWDIGTGRLYKTFTTDEGSINFLTYSPDGQYIALAFNKEIGKTGEHQGTIEIWDVTKGKRIKNITSESPNHLIRTLAYSPDGKYIASGGYEGVVRLWDSATGAQIKVFDNQPNKFISSIVFSPDGKYMASGCGKYIKVWKYN